MQVELGNVQGLIVSVYRRRVVRHLLFRFGGSAGARAFVRRLLPQVTMADAQQDSPHPFVNVGITYQGLQALDAAPALLHELSSSFREPPDPHLLGDAKNSRSAAEHWWDGRFGSEDVHCIVHLHADTDDAREAASAEVRALAGECDITELIPRKDGTTLDGRSLGGGRLHFDYTDGISHPDIAWSDESRRSGQLDFREFLLGYRGGARDAAPAHLRDGSYGAFRWIYQDVATFNRFLRTEGPRMFPEHPPAHAEELLAAKLMGRWRNGTPLVLSPDEPDPTKSRANDFGYAREDPDGRRCPFSAHIRVVNPRDQELDAVVAPGGVPPVIRRGMPYGPLLDGLEDDGRDRGLLGIFVCGDLRRQVYTLTDWIQRNTFSPVFDANRDVQDALVANRAVTGADPEFTIPRDGGDVTVTLPDFIHTKGTAFLLYPSRSTLRGLSLDAAA